MTDAGLEFRATKDIDLVLIMEAVDSDFGKRFWEYIKSAGYDHINKSKGSPQFYRFTNPKTNDYPVMIELFARKPDIIKLPDDAVLTPLLVDDEISSLSAILLNEDYYDFLKHGRVQSSGVNVMDALHLIPFKAKAWLDLSERKTSGEPVDSKNIRKHRNDVFRLTELLTRGQGSLSFLPDAVKNDMRLFIDRMSDEHIDLKQLGITGRTVTDILNQLIAIYE